MTTGSFCSGICAPEVAWHSLGWLPLFFSEIEPFPCAVEAQRFPGVPNLGDMTKVDGSAWRGLIDVLVAGTPCQAFSVAGNRGSLSDARGNLTLTFCELVHAIDPLSVVWENVPGVLSTEDNAFGCFLAGLVGAGQPLVSGREAGRWPSAGMVAGPKRSAAWRVLDAQYLNLAQRRERVFVVSFRTGDGTNPGAVLFEPESVPRDTAPSRETGKGIARGATQGIRDGCEVRIPSTGDISHCLNAGAMNRRDYESETFITCFGLNWQAGGQGGGAHFEQQSGCLIKNQVHGVAYGNDEVSIRRFTPRECERLQGFPDQWTLIQYKGKPAKDSPRYKALGNSMAVPVLRWIGERIEKVLNAHNELLRCVTTASPVQERNAGSCESAPDRG